MKPLYQSSELKGAIWQENRARRRRVPLWDRLQGSPTVSTPRLDDYGWFVRNVWTIRAAGFG
jgi:hypothetical protein